VQCMLHMPHVTHWWMPLPIIIYPRI